MIETAKPTPVLVVEDEWDHALLIQETIRDVDGPTLVRVVESGEAAIAYLYGDGKFADRGEYPFPRVVILDLRMPGIGGYGVLRWLGAHPAWRQKLSLIVLSAVQSQKDIEVVYELGAHLFLGKWNHAAMKEEIARLRSFWVAQSSDESVVDLLPGR